MTDTKTILLLCAFTFIPVKEWNNVPISDFTIMQEMDTTSIVLLTDEKQPSLMLVSMPGDDFIFVEFFFFSIMFVFFVLL